MLRDEAWVRPLLRATRAIQASARLITSTVGKVHDCKRRAACRPISTSKNLHAASGKLVDASARLEWAMQYMAELNACIANDPKTPRDIPRLLTEATESWLFLTGWLVEVADDLFSLQNDVLEGLKTGELVPEPERPRRPRIVLAPRPVPIRDFLVNRQHRAADRIASLLRRRRRTPRPAGLRVPRRSVLGRAPPFPVCPI